MKVKSYLKIYIDGQAVEIGKLMDDGKTVIFNKLYLSTQLNAAYGAEHGTFTKDKDGKRAAVPCFGNVFSADKKTSATDTVVEDDEDEDRA